MGCIGVGGGLSKDAWIVPCCVSESRINGLGDADSTAVFTALSVIMLSDLSEGCELVEVAVGGMYSSEDKRMSLCSTQILMPMRQYRMIITRMAILIDTFRY